MLKHRWTRQITMATKQPNAKSTKTNSVRADDTDAAQLHFLQTVFNASPDMIFILGHQSTVLDVNDAALKQFGYSKTDLYKQSLSHFMGKKSGSESLPGYFRTDTSSHASTPMFQWFARRRDGSEFPVEVCMNQLPKGLKLGPQTAQVLLTIRDISHRCDHEEKLIRLAHYDPVTGLINRSLLEDRANLALSRCQRQKKKMAFLFLDLDRFKQVNDELGHRIGDRLLKAVSMRIQSILRQCDTFGRLGGDEFLILAEDIQFADDAMHIGKKVIHCIAEPFGIDGHVIQVSTSVGISLYPEHGRALTNLIHHADKAMYRAKQLGRNQLAVYNPKLKVD